MNKVKIFGVLVLLGLFTMSFVNASPVSPTTLTRNGASTKTDFPSAKTLDAVAGNITSVTINATSVTKTWQGYYGNVTGTIVLDNSQNKSMYDWEQTSPTGQIYAVNASISDWSGIECFNFTAHSPAINLSHLEAHLGVGETDADGVNETFSTTTHDAFDVGSVSISANSCHATRTYVNDGASTDFQNVLLYEPTDKLVVYTGLIHQDTTGFDNSPHDFQLLVGEDGHGNTATTQYYFYVELS